MWRSARGPCKFKQTMQLENSLFLERNRVSEKGEEADRQRGREKEREPERERKREREK